MSTIEKVFVPFQCVAVTINGNPGRWCTGFSLIASLETAEWPEAFQKVLDANDLKVCKSREEVDLFVSILHGCSQEHIYDNYDYVVGFQRLEEERIYSCHFGLKKKNTPDAYVQGLISANIPIQEENKDDAYYASYGHIVNVHLKMELRIRAISLLSSFWHAKSAIDPNMEFPTDSQTLRMLDLTVAPPFGPFTKPMKKAIFNFMQALACSAAAARDHIKVKVDLTSA